MVGVAAGALRAATPLSGVVSVRPPAADGSLVIVQLPCGVASLAYSTISLAMPVVPLPVVNDQTLPAVLPPLDTAVTRQK